ncbi:MAG: DMT family transporter [Dehalococcoidia bacterium]|nr:DMT family transporter [Dehalococcoidia bacterium]RLC65588.1 MAG: EamA/RhaT family transporter [Chloroflexota bacterium]
MSANWRASPMIASVAFVGVTAVWGYTFLVVQDAIAHIAVMDFLAWRFIVASIVMIALRPTCLRNVTRLELLRGIGLGTVLGLGYIVQTYGLRYTSAATSGFITGMFVVLAPVMSWILLRRKTNRNTWMIVALATVGLALLSFNGWSIGIGELLTLVCAVFFAVHIVGLGEWSSEYKPYSLALLQIATVAVISLIAATHKGITVPSDPGVWKAVMITGILATAVAFFVQTWVQSLISPTRAAVIMTMEPVFAGLFAIVLGGDQLTLRTLGGAACILAAMLIINLRSGRSVAGQKT